MVSKGTHITALGEMTLVDFITLEAEKDQGDKIYEMRAADYAADLSGPVRELATGIVIIAPCTVLTLNVSPEVLLEVGEGASQGAAWGGRRRRGFPDPGEKLKRPGWQVRYPGIEEDTEMGNYVLNNEEVPSEAASLKDDVKDEVQKITKKEMKEREKQQAQPFNTARESPPPMISLI